MSAENKMFAIEVTQPNAPFAKVTRPIPEPGKKQLLIKVEACGICHSDSLVKLNHFPGITYPRVCGHEVVGIVVKVGEEVPRFKVGDRVAQGWCGGNHCLVCDCCRNGALVACPQSPATGISTDGGYAEYMISNWDALALVPAELKSEEAAPLMCAGVTVFNSMRNARIPVGGLVAVQGIGGLGHLAIQFANKMGFRVVALSTSEDKRQLALSLGAHLYIDCSKQDPVKELTALGGAKAIVCTSFDAKSISSLVNALGLDGSLIVLGATPEPLQISGLTLLMKRAKVVGWPSGSAVDSEDTLKFAALTGVRPQVELFTFDQAEEAYDKMMANKVRFRAVLVPSVQQS